MGEFVGILRAILPGARLSLECLVISVVLVFLLATGMAVCGNSKLLILRSIAGAYIHTFRSIPVLALMFLTFFGLPSLSPHLQLSSLWSAVVAITLSEGAYTAAIYQAALQSVGAGQWRAAESIGLSRTRAYLDVIFPQALLPAIPPSVNMVIWVVKDTAIASLIALNEMTLHATSLININAEPLKTYAGLMVMYVVVTVPLGYFGLVVETRLGKRFGAAARLR